jgi:hypothetical protein
VLSARQVSLVIVWGMETRHRIGGTGGLQSIGDLVSRLAQRLAQENNWPMGAAAESAARSDDGSGGASPQAFAATPTGRRGPLSPRERSANSVRPTAVIVAFPAPSRGRRQLELPLGSTRQPSAVRRT